MGESNKRQGRSQTTQKHRQNYIQKQKELKNKLKIETENKTNDKIERMAREGGTRSGNFWRTRKRLLRNDKNYDNQTKDENNNLTIKGESKIKEHIANYCENLYQAREQRKETIDWTEIINTKIKQLRKQTEQCTIKPFTELRN